MSRALPVVAALLCAPAGASAAEVYEWKYETRAFSYSKSVCGESTVYTEVVTQEIFNRASGVSHVGDGRRLPRGSSRSSGRIRYTYSKKVEGPDGTQHEDGSVTTTLPLLAADWGGVNSAGKGKRTLDVSALENGQPFGKLKRGKSITISLDRTSNPIHEDDGRCVTESTGNVTGSITIKRVR